MSFPTFLFYAFAAILVFAALRVVTTRNPVHAALWLVLAFFTAAAHWLMLRAEFLAIALVLVYVGAVMVLFLFVVMMLDVNFDSLRAQFRNYVPVAAKAARARHAGGEAGRLNATARRGRRAGAPATGPATRREARGTWQ
ncbi:MAG: NADH-quinone oxidoreductase subunit J [Betaproteobacteria bacterium]|nr:NADH-quinone oxidoreductase subunit J [Betaproteobacteria bacterium]